MPKPACCILRRRPAMTLIVRDAKARCPAAKPVTGLGSFSGNQTFASAALEQVSLKMSIHRKAAGSVELLRMQTRRILLVWKQHT